MIKSCWWPFWQKLWRYNLYLKNTFLLRRPRVANFADIIKVSTMYIKTTFKDSKKVKRIENYALKCNIYLYFSIKQKLLISGEKMLTSAELKRCVTWRPILNRVNARKTYNAYIDVGIFWLYFIVVICKSFCFVSINWYRYYYELQTSRMINFNWVLYVYIKNE